MFENVFCAIGLIAITMMVFAQVLNRYWFQFEIIWINDLAVYIFVFYMFFALMLTTRENGHIALEVLVDKFFGDTPVKKLCYGLFIRLVALAVVAITLYPAWRFAARALKYPQYATLVRWFNTSWMMEGLFAALCIVALHMLILSIEDAVALRSLLRKPAENDRKEV
jgi:TRAP-type C4-dicarboxylate transport system permease small subunit